MPPLTGNFPTFSRAGLPFKVAQPVGQGFTEVNAFLQKGHNRNGSIKVIENWTDVPFLSSRFTFSGTGSWGVTIGKVDYLKYARVDKILFYRGSIVTTDVTAPLGTELRVGLPSGMVVAGDNAIQTFFYRDAGGAKAVGEALAVVGTNYIKFQKLDGSNWTATAADDTTIHFNMALEIA